jgi:hypothetical protein
MEELILSDSVSALIEAVESLFYSMYARLIMEIANVELCTYFKLELQRTSCTDRFTLPEPSHLLKIFVHCKETLESPIICHNINPDLIKVHQDEFIRRSMQRSIGTEFFLDDLLGYRRYIMGIVGDPSSEFCLMWNHDAVLYQVPTDELLTIQSEKYLAFVPRVVAVPSVATADLPFVNRNSVNPDVREYEIIHDHRQAALAKLESRSIGDVRRVDDQRRPSEYMKQRKCICRASCLCAWDCTADPERPCPCADRMMQILLAKRRKTPGTGDFGSRCDSLAKAVFECATYIRRDINDVEIGLELDRAFLLIGSEIEKERSVIIRSTRVNYPSGNQL